MIITQRNQELKVCRAQREEKVLMVLEWLAEFRASNAQILARRLAVAVSNCHKLLSDMTAAGLIHSFENSHTRGLRLFALGKLGIGRLEVWGRDTQTAIIKAHNLSRSTTVLHDLCVQSIGLQLMERFQCSEIHWDHNIKTESKERPDLLLVRPDGFKAAVEFDRTAKSSSRFYERLIGNYESISQGHYHAAITASESEAVLSRYQNLFSAPEWPVFRKNSAGKLIELSSTITPLPHITREISWLPARDLVSDIFSSRLRPQKIPHEDPRTLELQPH